MSHTALKRKENTQSYDFTGIEFGKGVLWHVLQNFINSTIEFYDKIIVGHRSLLAVGLVT